MRVCASLALCFIPLFTLYICFVLLLKDFRKSVGAWACVLGMVSFLPIQLCLLPFTTLYAKSLAAKLLLYCLRGGVIEEGIKMLLLFAIPAKRAQKSAFASYAALFGVSLASLEDLIFLLTGHFFTTRLFAAMVIHTSCSVLSGLFVFGVKKKNAQILSFLFAVIFHGVYNYFADFADIRGFFAGAVILIAVFECVLRYMECNLELQSSTTSRKGETKKMENEEAPKKVSFWQKIKKLFTKEEPASSVPDTNGAVPEQTVFSHADGGNENTFVSQGDDAAQYDPEKTLVGDAEPESAVEETLVQENASLAGLALAPSAEVTEEFPSIPNIFTDDFGSDGVAEENAAPDSVHIEEIIREEPVLQSSPAAAVESAVATVAEAVTEEKTEPSPKAPAKKKTTSTAKAASTAQAKTAASSSAKASSAKKTAKSTTETTASKTTAKKAATSKVAKESAETKTPAAKKSASSETKAKTTATSRAASKATASKTSAAKPSTAKKTATSSTAEKTTASKTTVKKATASKTAKESAETKTPAAKKSAKSETKAKTTASASSSSASSKSKTKASTAGTTKTTTKTTASSAKTSTAKKTAASSAVEKKTAIKTTAKKTTASKTATSKKTEK